MHTQPSASGAQGAASSAHGVPGAGRDAPVRAQRLGFGVREATLRLALPRSSQVKSAIPLAPPLSPYSITRFKSAITHHRTCRRYHPTQPRYHPTQPRYHPTQPRYHPVQPRYHPTQPAITMPATGIAHGAPLSAYALPTRCP
eukprot:1513219-Rhodomonas_salina.1